jgi:hypothetical protein
MGRLKAAPTTGSPTRIVFPASLAAMRVFTVKR